MTIRLKHCKRGWKWWLIQNGEVIAYDGYYDTAEDALADAQFAITTPLRRS